MFLFCPHLSEWAGGRDQDLPFRIELWDDADRHVEELIALASDFTSACGAYEEAVKRRRAYRSRLGHLRPIEFRRGQDC